MKAAYKEWWLRESRYRYYPLLDTDAPRLTDGYQPLHVIDLGRYDRFGTTGPTATARVPYIRPNDVGPLREYYPALPLSGAGGHLLVPPNNEKWRIWQVIGQFVVDATVAARTARVQIGVADQVASAVRVGWQSDALTLTASEYGIVTMSNSAYHQMNDNGTITNSAAANTPIGFVLDGALSEYVKTVFTANGQLGDQSMVRVIYEVVE